MFSMKKQYGFRETSYSSSRVTEAIPVATAAACAEHAYSLTLLAACSWQHQTEIY